MSFDNDTTEAHERRITRCKTPGCNARIIFLETAAGKRIPVDADTVEPHHEQFEHSKHVSHFATCTDASAHRRARR